MMKQTTNVYVTKSVYPVYVPKQLCCNYWVDGRYVTACPCPSNASALGGGI